MLLPWNVSRVIRVIGLRPSFKIDSVDETRESKQLKIIALIFINSVSQFDKNRSSFLFFVFRLSEQVTVSVWLPILSLSIIQYMYIRRCIGVFDGKPKTNFYSVFVNFILNELIDLCMQSILLPLKLNFWRCVVPWLSFISSPHIWMKFASEKNTNTHYM